MIRNIFIGLSLVALLTACTDDYTDWSAPQAVPQPTQVSFADGSVASVDVIKFADIAEGQELVKVCTITAPTASADDFVPQYTLSLGGQTFNLSADGNINFPSLKEYVEATFGKAPVERSLDATVSMWLSNGITTIKTATSAVFPIKVIPAAPFIDTGYWLVGDMCAWDKDGAKPFNHLGSGNVYDAPEFQIVVTTTADNQYWKIIPQGNYDGDFWAGGDTGVLGTAVDGDTSMEGTLTTQNPQAGKIEKAGIYRITINMMEYKYKIEKLEFAPYIYFIGATDGWSNAEQKLATLAGSWDNEINFDTFSGGVSGDFAQGGGSNIKANAGEGIYYITADLASGTLKGVRINNMNLVGDFNGWNPGDDAQQMTWDAENYCYVINNAGVNSKGWKFTANNSWDINLGGDISNLTANGDNLTVEGKTIKLYPTRKTSDKIYCTVE